MQALVLTGFFSLLIGAVLGLFGGGGGILAVPLLVYVVGVGAKPAIAVSLFFVGATSTAGALLAARAGRVQWKLGGLFGAGSMLSAFAGGHLAQFVPERWLLGALAALMLTTGLAMLRARGESSDSVRPPALMRMLAIGTGVGLVSGLVGAGGGFLIVPALTLFGGLALCDAIGTSLFIVAVQSFAGFAGHVGHVELDWRLATLMTGPAVVGIFAGSAMRKRVSSRALERGFAGLVLATGLFVVARQIPTIWVLFIAGAVLVASFLVACKAAPARLTTTEHREKACMTSAPGQPCSAAASSASPPRSSSSLTAASAESAGFSQASCGATRMCLGFALRSSAVRRS